MCTCRKPFCWANNMVRFKIMKNTCTCILLRLTTDNMNLIDLPVPIKKSIIKYLPQQALINLSLANFEFYQPCLQQLYKNITIQYNPPLRPNEKTVKRLPRLYKNSYIRVQQSRWQGGEQGIELENDLCEVGCVTTIDDYQSGIDRVHQTDTY